MGSSWCWLEGRSMLMDKAGCEWSCLLLQVNLSNASRTQGGNSFDDSTLPLIDRNQKTGMCLPFST